MASMQIVGGGTNASPGKGAVPGGLDPLLMGLSPEAAALSGGEAGESAENPFVAELAAALASFEAEQTTTLAENLLDPALQAAQTIDPNLAAQAQGQTLPLDPAFQNAILASFAALNGAVQADASAIGATDAALAASAGALDAVELAAGVTAVQSAAVQNGTNSAVVQAGDVADAALAAAAQSAHQDSQQQQSDADAQRLREQGLVTAQRSAQDLLAQAASQTTQKSATTESATPTAEQAAQLAQASSEAKKAAAASAQAGGQTEDDLALNGKNSSSPSIASNTTIQPGPSLAQQGQQKHSDSEGQSGLGNADRQPSVAEQAGATELSPESDSPERTTKQTAMAGTAANDLGNVILTTKSNADAIAASADSARQSAQRVDGAAATGAAAASAQSAEAARAESRLEAARASLGSGPLNVEVLKLTRQGGGRAVLEVTPPNQGPIRIDLQLDGAGRASLVVEGLTDSMKARLESSAHFLRQDMASMGLALNLEMRERNDSNAQAQAFGQGQFGQSRQNDREVGAGQTQSSMSGQAPGNVSGARRSTVTDDGIHLVA
ncbi:MAG: flagellar hook-length control protein FliK [Betaproteobacteria bacterium]|nr:flagellar hook-length control protein FliK [Betaproteobacteria bacterium]